MTEIEDNPAAVALQFLTSANWTECTELRVAEDQADYVDTNLYCIAECAVEPQWQPMTIYSGETMVGFVVFGLVEGGSGVIHHLMIDREHQGKGYGHAAMLEVIQCLQSLPACSHIELSYWPGNPGVRLYERLGFEHTGEEWDEEPVMRLNERASS
ncbi:MAG: GNAT family N-acetyltransferase [Thermomicrobiales bacterium]